MAPYIAISFFRSSLAQSGMKMWTGWPVNVPSAEKAMPVLPLVISTMGWPGFRVPLAVDLVMTWAARRSLMLPERLYASSFAQTKPSRPSSL